jgi:hypothetical protein
MLSPGGSDNDDRQQPTVPRLSPTIRNKWTKSWSIINVISQNVNGYSGGPYSTDIASILNSSKTTTIFIAQETWDNDNTMTEIDGVLFLSSGCKKENNHQRHGGCGIALSNDKMH